MSQSTTRIARAAAPEWKAQAARSRRRPTPGSGGATRAGWGVRGRESDAAIVLSCRLRTRAQGERHADTLARLLA